MSSFTHFSAHAFQRLSERTELSPELVGKVLDQKLYVNTGREHGFNREHLLFYSVPDAASFVAVRDLLTGTVVTVLPLEFHENLAWKVSEAQCESAKALALKYTEKVPSKGQSPSQFVFKLHYSTDNNSYKATTLMRTPISGYDGVKALLADPEVLKKVASAIREKGIRSEQVHDISVRVGNSGEPVWLPLEPLKPLIDVHA